MRGGVGGGLYWFLTLIDKLHTFAESELTKWHIFAESELTKWHIFAESELTEWHIFAESDQWISKTWTSTEACPSGRLHCPGHLSPRGHAVCRQRLQERGAA